MLYFPRVSKENSEFIPEVILRTNSQFSYVLQYLSAPVKRRLLFVKGTRFSIAFLCDYSPPDN